VARQEPISASANDPARAVALPPERPVATLNFPKQRDDPRVKRGQNAAAPPALPPKAIVTAEAPARRTGVIAVDRPPVRKTAPRNTTKQHEDPPKGRAQIARPAAPAAPLDPKQVLTLNVHLVDYQAWPALEARIKALAGSKAQCKANRSGDYMWVTLSPVKIDTHAFALKINFGKIVAVYPDQRLIYVDTRR
jgi:hypothetical protein